MEILAKIRQIGSFGAKFLNGLDSLSFTEKQPKKYFIQVFFRCVADGGVEEDSFN